jgi:hypothetical protein
VSLLLLLNATATTGPAGVYTHSFPGIRPRARFDDSAWTSITVAESATRTGTFTDLITQTLDPAEADPTVPQTRDITVTGATLAAGWYRFTFTDDAGETEVFDPIFAGPGVRPAVAEIAALMPDRTTLDGGTEARTFNSETTPTSAEVENLIDMVLDAVDPRIPDGASPEVMRAGRHVVTLNTAILVESGNWGDQIETNQARVALWERLLTAHEQTLDSAASDNQAGSARFGSITVTSPTLSSWASQAGVASTELIP